jgi:hypothetical protein
VGEDKMSLYSSTILSTYFCCVERPCVEAMDADVTFYSLLEKIMKKKNFPVWEITFLHCLA